MQPFSISEPLTPLARGQECASTVVVNNMADTPLLLKVRTSNKKVEVAPVVFVLMPNCRERVELLSHGADEAELEFSAIFVDASEPILNETDSGLLNGFFERMISIAERDQQFIEQVLVLHFDERIVIEPGSEDYKAKLIVLREEVAKLQNELSERKSSENSKESELEMLKARFEMKSAQRSELELEVRQKSMFKRVFGVHYKHAWSLALLACGIVSGILAKKLINGHRVS